MDPETTAVVLKLLDRVNKDLGVTVVVITHEMDVVRAIANRVAVLDDGRLVEVGSVFDAFSAPQADTTREFVETALQDEPEPEDTAPSAPRPRPSRWSSRPRSGSPGSSSRTW